MLVLLVPARSLAVLAIALSSALSFGQPPSQPAIADQETKRLLDQLGAPRYSDREAAANKLAEDQTSRPFLLRLADSTDAEVATRARQVISRLDRLRFSRFIRYGREGQIERMAEGLCSWDWPVERDEYWQEVRAVVLAIWERLDDDGRPTRPNDFQQNLERVKQAPVFVRLNNSTVKQVRNGGFVSTGRLLVEGNFANASLVASGAVSIDGNTAAAILITTDDVVSGGHYPSHVSSLVVVAAGRVRLHQAVAHSLIVARGDIDVTDCAVGRSHLATSGKIVGADKLAEGSKLRIKTPPERTLQNVRWFETATVGFEATAVENGMKVDSVGKSSVAARGGLRAGDVIVAIDDRSPWKSAEEFRRQLRRGSVQDRCVLSVQRGTASASVLLDFRTDYSATKAPGVAK